MTHPAVRPARGSRAPARIPVTRILQLERRRQLRRARDWDLEGLEEALDDARGPATLVALGFVGGLAVGAFAWSRLLEGSSRQLFSAHPSRRYWAVSYLGARPSVDTARLLRDYVRWEPHPLLRRRARRVLATVEAALER